MVLTFDIMHGQSKAVLVVNKAAIGIIHPVHY